jgi:hypothetical protein
MVNQTETFNLNEHMHEAFDYNDVHMELRNLTQDSMPLVDSISMPSILLIALHFEVQYERIST